MSLLTTDYPISATASAAASATAPASDMKFERQPLANQKRKRGMLPKPLPQTKRSKNRVQARSVAKQARVFETVDLVEACQNVNLLQNVTILHDSNSINTTFDPNHEMISPYEALDVNLLPNTQNVIDTVFEDKETDDAIEAFMVALNESTQCRATSPDIFEEDAEYYKTDTICFMEEKIALIETKIEVIDNETQKLTEKESELLKTLCEIKSKLNSHDSNRTNLKSNLEKFKSFRNAL